MKEFEGKKVLVVGLGRTGFALIHYFSALNCEIRATDLKPIFDLSKQVKRIKRMEKAPELTLGEHRDEDFLEADIVVYSPSIDPHLPQLELARSKGKQVYSEFALAYKICDKPMIAICGSLGRTTIAHMIGYILKASGKNCFVGGSSEKPLIEYFSQPDRSSMEYVVTEASAKQLQTVDNFKPFMTVFSDIQDQYDQQRFKSFSDYADTKFRFLKNLSAENFVIANFDKLSSNANIRNAPAQVYWYSRKSFVDMGVVNEVQGTHFHERRIHSNIHYHSEFIVSKMRILGRYNRENLLAAITACKVIKCPDAAIQKAIENFPGISHSLEFITERNGVRFYNDSKCESMEQLKKSLEAAPHPVILIAGGKDTNQDYGHYAHYFKKYVRILILVGEAKENMNRILGDQCQTFLVGSFDESILLSYQKSRNGDIILLSPGNKSTDIFRDFEERGNYFKKLVFQL